jgi:hypothetical protein
MYGELIDEWVETRDGEFGRVTKIDKRDYCTLVDAAGNVVKGHEPAHALTVSLKALVDGTAGQEFLRLSEGGAAAPGTARSITLRYSRSVACP